MSDNTLKIILDTDTIEGTIDVFNSTYMTIYKNISGVQASYNDVLDPLLNFYSTYAARLLSAVDVYNNNVHEWNDFLTTVQSNSAKWLQPFTIFYPVLINGDITNDVVNTINDWVRKYYPVKNADGTLNYVEGQKIIVSAYTYKVQETFYVPSAQSPNGTETITFPFFVRLQSYCECDTHGATITANCASEGTGQPSCENAVYSCAGGGTCSTSKFVNCWYIPPYLNLDQSPITSDQVKAGSVQNALSLIQADININYQDRQETALKNIIFTISDCDWKYKATT